MLGHVDDSQMEGKPSSRYCRLGKTSVATVRFGFLSNLMQSLRINPGVVDQTSVHSIDIVFFTHGTTSHMRTMVLEYLPTKLGHFWGKCR